MKSKIKTINKSRLFFVLLSIVFMIIIFMFSSENGDDSKNTSRIYEFVVRKHS